MTDRDAAVLDDPVGESLRGHHAHLARRLGHAAAYPPDVTTFSTVSAGSATSGPPSPAAWSDLAKLLGSGELADMFSCTATPPADWEPVFTLDGLQARGRGHATRLLRALVARITSRNDRPFLHVIRANSNATTLYEELGFVTRKSVTFRGFRTP